MKRLSFHKHRTGKFQYLCSFFLSLTSPFWIRFCKSCMKWLNNENKMNKIHLILFHTAFSINKLSNVWSYYQFYIYSIKPSKRIYRYLIEVIKFISLCTSKSNIKERIKPCYHRKRKTYSHHPFKSLNSSKMNYRTMQ